MFRQAIPGQIPLPPHGVFASSRVNMYVYTYNIYIYIYICYICRPERFFLQACYKIPSGQQAKACKVPPCNLSNTVNSGRFMLLPALPRPMKQAPAGVLGHYLLSRGILEQVANEAGKLRKH